MDSNQASIRSVEGSTATFEFAGGDTETAHSESHTATVSLAEFHAIHSIYNVNDNTNKLEILNQMQDYNGNLIQNKSIVLQIPNGSYNITSLVQVLNEQMFSKTGSVLDENGNSYTTGFGDKTIYEKEPSFLNFGLIPAFYIDYVATNNYTDPTMAFDKNNFVQNKVSGKIKFTSASTYEMQGVYNESSSTDLNTAYNANTTNSTLDVFESYTSDKIKYTSTNSFSSKCTVTYGYTYTITVADTNDFNKIAPGMSVNGGTSFFNDTFVVSLGANNVVTLSKQQFFVIYFETYDRVVIFGESNVLGVQYISVSDTTNLVEGTILESSVLPASTYIKAISGNVLVLSNKVTGVIVPGATTFYSNGTTSGQLKIPMYNNLIGLIAVGHIISEGTSTTIKTPDLKSITPALVNTFSSNTYVTDISNNIITLSKPLLKSLPALFGVKINGYIVGTSTFIVDSTIFNSSPPVVGTIYIGTGLTSTTFFPPGTTIINVSKETNSFTTSTPCILPIPINTVLSFNIEQVIVSGTSIIKMSQDPIAAGITVGCLVTDKETTRFLSDYTYVYAINGKYIKLSQPVLTTPTSTITLNFKISGGLVINGSGKARLHRGFYILTDTYKGLAEIMGFSSSKSIALPTYSTIVNKIAQNGFGITLNVSITTTSVNKLVEPFYSIDTGYSNPIYVKFDTTDVNTIPAKTSTFKITPPYGVFTCQAPDCPSLDYPRNIYICIDQMTTRNRCSNSKFAYGSVLAKIPTNQNFGDTILYEPFDLKEIYLPGLSLDTLTVRLYDDDAQPIQWNGGHWTLIINVAYNIDVGSAGLEDATMGRTYRPYLKRTQHDPLTTSAEFAHKRIR